MKNIGKYLKGSSSKLTVTIKLVDDHMVIVTVFDKDFDDEKTFRFSMDEWKSLLLKTLNYGNGVQKIEVESES